MTGLYRAKFETSYLTKVQNARRQARIEEEYGFVLLPEILSVTHNQQRECPMWLGMSFNHFRKGYESIINMFEVG